MIYQSVLGAVVSALAAEAIDTTSKQAWQKLYNSADEGEGGDLATLFGTVWRQDGSHPGRLLGFGSAAPPA